MRLQISGPPDAFAKWKLLEGEDVEPTEFLLGEDDKLVHFEVDKLRNYGFTTIIHGNKQIELQPNKPQ